MWLMDRNTFEKRELKSRAIRNVGVNPNQSDPQEDAPRTEKLQPGNQRIFRALVLKFQAKHCGKKTVANNEINMALATKA